MKYFYHQKRHFVSPSGHVIFYLLHKHQWNTKSFKERHRMAQFSYVTIATVNFSRVKITCYLHVWRYQVFAQKLTWYFIGVYIINDCFYPDTDIHFLSSELAYLPGCRACQRQPTTSPTASICCQKWSFLLFSATCWRNLQHGILLRDKLVTQVVIRAT